MHVAPATYGLVAALLTLSSPALAQYQPARPDLSQRAMPVPGLDRIGVDEHLGARVPLDLRFRDLEGRDVRLGDVVGTGRPTLLAFAYFRCTTICSMFLDSVERGLRDVPWTAGDQYDLVVVSIDPAEDMPRARRKRAELVARYGRDVGARGFRVLTGSQASIDALTRAAGYRYFYDERQDQYAHPAAAMFLMPDGRIARYLYGLDFQGFDMRLALLEASQGRSMRTTDHILQYCYAFDPTTSTYTAQAMRVMQLGGLVTMMIMGAGFAYLRRRERGNARNAASQSTQTFEVGV